MACPFARFWRTMGPFISKLRSYQQAPCSHILIALQMTLMNAEDLPVTILWQAEDAGTLLALALLAFLGN